MKQIICSITSNDSDSTLTSQQCTGMRQIKSVIIMLCAVFFFRYKIKIKSKHEGPADHEMYLVPQQSTSNTIMLQQTLPSTHKQNGAVRNEQQFYPATNTMNAPGHGQNNDTESVKYYVLERPPGYINDNQLS